MKKGKIMAGVLALFTGAVYPAFFMHADTACCEKIYDVKLSVDTVEVDINSIPENREVQVGVNIENNPGFLGIVFNMEFDSNIEYDELKIFLFQTNDKIGLTYEKITDKIINIAINNADLNSLYENNGDFFDLTVKIPENCKPGDFYFIKPILDYQHGDYFFQALFCQENSFDNDFYQENFA